MCTFKNPLIYFKTPKRLDVMQGYGTIAGFSVKTLGFYKMQGLFEKITNFYFLVICRKVRL